MQQRRQLVRGQGARVRRETPRETPVELRAYGRRTFLAVTGIGLSSLLWAKPVWQVVSGATQPAPECAAGRASSRRRAGASTPSPRRCRGSTRPRGGCASTGSSSSRGRSTYDELAPLPRAEQVSTFHCVTGWSVNNVHWAGVRLDDLLATAGAAPDAQACSPSSRPRQPYVDTLTLEQARPRRRDARLRDGREAALGACTARRSGS